jgi:hypothetical protein
MILGWNEASFTRIAIPAHGHGGTYFTIVMTSSSVNSTSFVSDFIFIHPFESVNNFTAMASEIGGLTRY